METKIQERNEKRKAGILLPVFSLPGDSGIGTLGKQAYRFVDWLCKAKMKIWQVLPLLPTNYGDSPYQSCASDALNFYFLDFDLLAEENLLNANEYQSLDWGDSSRVDYGKLFAWKANVLKIAFSRFDKTKKEWKDFLADGKYRDFAVFMAIKNKFGYRPWTEWAEEYKIREEKTLACFEKENQDEIEFWQFTQYLFLKQWKALKSYANERGVSVMGDMPIYVAYDSVETWKYRKELFMLNEYGDVTLRAGVPPDAFSDEGQLWGNPVYDWKKMSQNGYKWWKNRIEYAFTLFDIVRIDHFRGFDRFYTVAEGEETAKFGEWRKGPGAELFKDMKTKQIVAEDLGVIDDGVREMMKETGYPGMKVLSFGFDGNPDNEHKASNHLQNVYAYTGTHDNAPVRAMLESFDEDKLAVFALEMKIENERLGLEVELDLENNETPVLSLGENLIEQLFASSANVAILLMQDLLLLGEESRINAPSTVGKNWTFRFQENDFGEASAEKLAYLTEKYNR